MLEIQVLSVIIFLELSTLISNILINDITVKLPPIIDEECRPGREAARCFARCNPCPGTIKRAMFCLLLLRSPDNTFSGPPLMEPECHQGLGGIESQLSVQWSSNKNLIKIKQLKFYLPT
ncbi:MAG: hypothetical protein JRG73_00745 [Deltaproteobacteria bacterium]|nr:hypothetical protein [Deltaproteobacteria bacterium]